MDKIEKATIEDASKSAPKVLISYAWEDEEHKEWVNCLGTKLRKDGIDVILDQWSTKLGDQLPHFMEQSVRDSDFVVFICTPEYKRKSDGRIGGVGYEGHIITSEIYSNNNQGKFIPVLRRGDWDNAIPSWAKGKLGVSLTGEQYSEEQYEQLLQYLHGLVPGPPPLGPKPRKERFTTKAIPPVAAPSAPRETESDRSGEDVTDEVTDAEIRMAQFEIQRIDTLNEGRPMEVMDIARSKTQKRIILERLIKRLKAEGRTALAHKFERQIRAIQLEGRVATPLQKKADQLNDLAAEEYALKEEERRKKKKNRSDS